MSWSFPAPCQGRLASPEPAKCLEASRRRSDTDCLQILLPCGQPDATPSGWPQTRLGVAVERHSRGGACVEGAAGFQRGAVLPPPCIPTSFRGLPCSPGVGEKSNGFSWVSCPRSAETKTAARLQKDPRNLRLRYRLLIRGDRKIMLDDTFRPERGRFSFGMYTR